MSAVAMDGAEVRLVTDDNTLRFVRVQREQNEVRIVFQHKSEAEEVESTLLTAAELRRAAVLPSFSRGEQRCLPPRRRQVEP